jgi:hypothetical protein
MGAHEDGEVASSGEADDANAVAVDAPLGCMLAGEAHGLLRVFEVGVVGRIVALLWDAVFDEQTGDADGVEPLAGVGAFTVPGEADVASAGKDESGDSGVVARRLIDAESRLGDVGEAL